MAMNTLVHAKSRGWLVHAAALVAAWALVAGGCDRDRRSRTERAVDRVGALPEREIAPFQACARDEDCTWTTNGCCDCANGGIEIGIARGQELAFKERLACATKNIPCHMMANDRVCGTGQIKCERSRCIFRPPFEQLP